MTDVDIFRLGGVSEDDRDERARRAAAAGRKMLPTLTSLARVMTGRKDVRVIMSASDNGSTDGTKIYWRPPIELGDRLTHHPALCDKRDENLQNLCSACARIETVYVVIFHEIAHQVYDTFATVTDAAKVDAVERALQEVNSTYARKVQEILENERMIRGMNYLGMSKLISPYMPFLINCLEDARVNRELFTARAGAKKMFDATTIQVFSQGVPQPDNSIKMWSEYPANPQVSVGVFCLASGYDFTGWFHPQVEEALRDRLLGNLVRRIDTVRSAEGVYYLAFPILARLRELGFLRSEIDPPSEEDEDPGDERSDEPNEPGMGEPEEGGSPGAGGVPSEEVGAEEDSDDGAPGGGGESPLDGDDSESGGSEPDCSDDAASGRDGVGSDGLDDGSAASDSASDDTDEASDEDSGTGDGGIGDDSDPADVDDSLHEAEDESSDSGDVAGSSPDEGAPGSSSEDTDDGADAASGEPVSEGDPSAGGAGDTPQATDESHEGSGDIEGVPNTEGEVDDEREDSPSGGGPGSSGGSNSDQDDVPSGDDRSGGSDSGDPSGDPSGESDADGDAEGTDGPSEVDGDDDVSDGSDGNEPSRGDALDESDESDDLFDPGADKGLGGNSVIEDSDNDHLPLGTPEECEELLGHLGGHHEEDDRDPRTVQEAKQDEEALDRAIVQGEYFETPSRNIFGVRFHRFGQPLVIDGYDMSGAWSWGGRSSTLARRIGASSTEDELLPGENVLGPALLRMRVAFSDNKRGHDQLHRRSGKVNGRVLGRRAWSGDDRLFRTRTLPGNRSYFVCIGIDVSGSTVGLNIHLIKRAALAQAELCSRMGINFAIYGHSGNYHDPSGGRADGMDVEIYLIKEPNEPWNTEVKNRLLAIGPDVCNLDGHTLEYYRKVCDSRPETDKIIMYYTDGKMPAENHDEELVILQREIQVCRRKNYTLLGVGIRTDSPVRHGLDTVQVDDDNDIAKVVKHLEKRLSVRG